MIYIAKYENLTGKKFGRLFVVEKAEYKNNRIQWLCKCDCGNEIEVDTNRLKSGKTKSCGCFQKERAQEANATHRQSRTRIYNIWCGIKKRCYNKNEKRYNYYGGRGITVCEEWKNNFESFRDWALSHGYADNLTIDRIDVNGNYEPLNCRWATTKEQNSNTRANRLITYKGKTQILSQWAAEYGLNDDTLLYRIKAGWSVEKALTTPCRKMRRKQRASA